MRTQLTKTQRCPKCGDYMILIALQKALQALQIPKHMVVVVSGIGCSGKMAQYIDCYGAETLHGRVVPFASGVKLANPALTVIGIGGDGDGYGIGLGHFLHGIRRNINMLYIVCNNQNYALTTGQTSPTTPCNVRTSSTPSGNTLTPIDPCGLAKTMGAGYTVTGTSDDIPGLTNLIQEGISYPGFAHIDVAQACPSRKKW